MPAAVACGLHSQGEWGREKESHRGWLQSAVADCGSVVAAGNGGRGRSRRKKLQKKKKKKKKRREAGGVFVRERTRLGERERWEKFSRSWQKEGELK